MRHTTNEHLSHSGLKKFPVPLDLRPANAIIQLILCCFLWTPGFQRKKIKGIGWILLERVSYKRDPPGILSLAEDLLGCFL